MLVVGGMSACLALSGGSSCFFFCEGSSLCVIWIVQGRLSGWKNLFWRCIKLGRGGGGVMFRGTGICGFRFACGAGVCSGFVTIFCSGQGRFGDMCLVSCQKV